MNAVFKKFSKFLFEYDGRVFFNIFSVLAPIYGIFRLWRWDWHVFEIVSREMAKPVGLFELVNWQFPTQKVLIAVQVLGTLAGFGMLSRIHFRSFAFVFFVCQLLLDSWQNMFGFINVEIHYVWFLGLLCLWNPSKSEVDEVSSFAFRMCELVAVLVYFQAALSKLHVSGLGWALDGTTFQFALLRQEVPLGMWLAQYTVICKGLSIFSLIFELGFGLYFFTGKSKPIFWLVGLSFHIGTWFLLKIDFAHLWVFSISWLAAFALNSNLVQKWLDEFSRVKATPELV